MDVFETVMSNHSDIESRSAADWIKLLIRGMLLGCVTIASPSLG